jgi:diguanylate cyclase (GGDEF)-like protein
VSELRLEEERDSTHLGALGGSLRGTIAVFFLVIFLEGLMQQIGYFHDGQAVWWPTNGLALALLLCNRRSNWLRIMAAVLLGSLAGTLYHGFPLAGNLGSSLANAIGPVAAAWMLPRFRQLEQWMQEPRIVARFVVWGMLLAPLLSAAIHAGYVHLYLHQAGFWITLQRRAVADMLGYALFTPLSLVLGAGNASHLVRRKTLGRTLPLLLLVAGVSSAVFLQSSFALAFVLTSVLLMVALQLGFAGSVIAVNLLAAIATAATMHGHGPLTMGGGTVVSSRIILLQCFLTVSMVTVFEVAVVQIEREVFQSKLRMAYEHMEELAETDPLTGVKNRRHFDKQLQVEWARAFRKVDRIALLLIDADHFKSYNDSFGHQAGDECLRAIAQAANAMQRRSTDLLARYGGEEFVLLLPTSGSDGALLIANAIRLSVEGLNEIENSKLKSRITVSIGCAYVVPGPGLTPEMLIDASDRALYRAKQRGRNCVEVGDDPVADQRLAGSATPTMPARPE